MHKATKNTTHLFVNKSDTNKTFECASWKQTQLLVAILPRKQKQILNCYKLTKTTLQRAKKVVSVARGFDDRASEFCSQLAQQVFRRIHIT